MSCLADLAGNCAGEHCDRVSRCANVATPPPGISNDGNRACELVHNFVAFPRDR